MARESADNMTSEEDAAMTAAALRDSDNPPLTDVDFAKMQPLSQERLRRLRGQRGPQVSKPVKERVSLRLDPDVVAHFKRRGPGWQSRINATLRKALKLPKMAKKA
jgi:uncharacterized protein (DUF4415 family)